MRVVRTRQSYESGSNVGSEEIHCWNKVSVYHCEQLKIIEYHIKIYEFIKFHCWHSQSGLLKVRPGELVSVLNSYPLDPCSIPMFNTPVQSPCSILAFNTRVQFPCSIPSAVSLLWAFCELATHSVSLVWAICQIILMSSPCSGSSDLTVRVENSWKAHSKPTVWGHLGSSLWANWLSSK